MEKFDATKFHQFEKSKIANYILTDGTIIEAKQDDNGLFEEFRKKPGSPYSLGNLYYSNLQIKKSFNYFYRMRYGKTYEYDERGNIVSRIDNDIEFRFSIEMLIDKMKREFDIDLMKPKDVFMADRYVDRATKNPEYLILYTMSSSKLRRIVVHGITGKTVVDKEVEVLE